MHARYIFCLVALAVLAAPSLSQAAGSPFFGGRVVLTQPCNTGLLLTVVEPFGITEQLMWLYGELPYLMHVPPHISQNMIGMSAGVSPCILGTIPEGQGSIILFHGSSI